MRALGVGARASDDELPCGVGLGDELRRCCGPFERTGVPIVEEDSMSPSYLGSVYDDTIATHVGDSRPSLSLGSLKRSFRRSIAFRESPTGGAVVLRWLLVPRRGLLAVDGVRLGVFTEIRDPTSETSLSAEYQDNFRGAGTGRDDYRGEEGVAARDRRMER